MDPVLDGTEAGYDPAQMVPLGDTTVSVTQMAIGTVPIGGLFDSVAYDDARAMLEAGWDSGVRFFDVAPLYSYGIAERVVGDVLRQQSRDSYTLATKVGRLPLETGPTERGDTTVLYQGEHRFGDTDPVKPYFDSTCDAVIRRHRVKQLAEKLALGDAYVDQGLVYADPAGGLIHPDGFGKAFLRLQVEAGLPRTRFHDLRVRHEALCDRMGCKDPPSGCRSSPVKLGAA